MTRDAQVAYFLMRPSATSRWVQDMARMDAAYPRMMVRMKEDGSGLADVEPYRPEGQE